MFMSKISEESSVRETLVRYSRQFAVLVTAWLRKYQDDPFFRTEVNAIALQVAFAAFMIAVVGASFSYNTQGVSTAIVSGIREGLSSSAPSSVGPKIVNQVENIRTQNFIVVLAIITFTT